MKYQSNLNLLVALLLVSISLAGCAQSAVAPTEVATEVATSTPEPPIAKAAADLEGTLWKLDSYLNSQGESVGVLPDTEVTIEFKDGQIGGSAGCNTYFGSYEVEGDSLTIGPIGVTEMFCVAPENVMEQESAYLAALQSAASYQVTDDQFQMANADGETVLSFSVLEPESLTDTMWRLTGYNNGQGGFISLLIGTEITALFGDDGNLSGSAGCNRYTASYEVEGATISVGPAAATRMMCAQPEGIMEQESAYLSMLESAAAYQVRGDTLKMLDGDGEHLLSYTAETEIGMANPASVHCEEQGGQLEIRTADDGGQYGVCIFPNGSECEEWAFFRGECVPASTPPLSLEALKNATYPSEWEESGTITLTDGRYEGEPFVEGGASRPIVTLVEPVAFGDLDGDGVEDAAVVLAANAGGSGTFISLEAVRNEGGEPVHVATYSLGDRARIESLAIEGGQIVLEMITHGPDDPLCCPTQRARNVYALEGDALIEVSSEVIGAVEEPSKPTAQLTLEALQNASYQGIYDEPVQLTDGRYEGEPFVPGSASRPTVVLHPEVYAFGDLNGDGVDDAVVILIENSGGSGNFRYLAVVINQDGTLVNVATQFVGDREQAQLISIEDGEITLEMVAHGPDDPMCCPTQEVTKVYQLQDDQLVEVLVGLEGTLWTLVSYGDPSDPQAVLEGSEITAEFDSAKGTVTGSAGCNSYFGAYEVDGDTISFGPLGSTMMACPEPEGIMAQELAFLTALGSAVTYQIEGDKLELVDADSTRLAQFVALPPASLAGTEWTLTAYNNGQEAVVSVLIGTEITGAFGDDGRLTGLAGCNTYGASFEVDGDHIVLGPAVTTRMW